MGSADVSMLQREQFLVKWEPISIGSPPSLIRKVNDVGIVTVHCDKTQLTMT